MRAEKKRSAGRILLYPHGASKFYFALVFYFHLFRQFPSLPLRRSGKLSGILNNPSPSRLEELHADGKAVALHRLAVSHPGRGTKLSGTRTDGEPVIGLPTARADDAGEHPEIGDGLTIDVQDRQVAQVVAGAKDRQRSIAHEIATRHAVAKRVELGQAAQTGGIPLARGKVENWSALWLKKMS